MLLGLFFSHNISIPYRQGNVNNFLALAEFYTFVKNYVDFILAVENPLSLLGPQDPCYFRNSLAASSSFLACSGLNSRAVLAISCTSSNWNFFSMARIAGSLENTSFHEAHPIINRMRTVPRPSTKKNSHYYSFLYMISTVVGPVPEYSQVSPRSIRLNSCPLTLIKISEKCSGIKVTVGKF